MNLSLKPKTSNFKKFLLSSVFAAGIVGVGHSGLFTVTPSFADAVTVEAPAVFSFADVVEAVSPAVVSVRVESRFEPASDVHEYRDGQRGRDFFEHFFRNGPRGVFPHDGSRPRRHNTQSQGSGFFVSEDGYVVTNNHVIDGGTKFTVVLNDGKEHEATLVGKDERTDLAVLKVDADRDFTYVDFGGARPRIGEWVVAVGNPFGLGGTVTAGIVSAHGREIGATRYDDFIQIDAAVNKGNSGGPAFNLKGEVVGVNTAIFSPSGGNVGIAFAIPAALAEEVVEDLIDDGSVTRGWLGVQIQPVTPEIAESLGLEDQKGTIVANAQAESPAAVAGLISGDVITAVDGKPVNSPRALARVIAGYEPDSDITLTLWRNGETRELSVELGELPQAEADMNVGKNRHGERLGKLGLALEPSEDGVRIVDVKPGSPADKRGLRRGDVIASVNGKKIDDVRDLREAMKTVREEGRKSALLQVDRGERTLFVPVPLERG